MDLSNTMFTVKDFAAKLNERTSEIVDIGKMPTSCTDLQRMGHKLSGFFSVKGSNKMEMIYCDFYPNENEIQTRIGYVDVKSAPVHFYVTRDTTFKLTNTPIPFDLVRMNEGNAMDLASGKFTAPRPGIYYFSFTGHALSRTL
ncbi:C1q and tumor necrosis factor-related protein 5 [Daphnia pulex]|uniref:C1q and tumor necrosis factor-related protein 5 n=1 Tax=Daphnia pulex TaxID=6669 RepID=E9HGR5_DAPPU|nr:C1q and tumor necrosis factor-related protein 5 [Daphnia pulex]|eukprot:EFX69010.1 C1q and tumor necrosis factor-related protein 5 [Daphnia pulex]